MILILVKQILQMFLLAGIGYLLFKGGKISLEGSKTIGNILIYGSLPAVIINGFRIERTAEHVSGLLWSAAAALTIVLLSILISRLIFRKDAIAAFAGFDCYFRSVYEHVFFSEKISPYNVGA